MLKTRIVLPILALMLAALACNLPGRNFSTPTSDAAQLPTVAATPDIVKATVNAATPTKENPGAKATVTTAPKATQAEMVEFSYKGVKFSYQKGQFSDIQGQITPGEANDPTGSGWMGQIPQYYQIDFNSYPLKYIFHKPQILVFPIKTFASINPPSGDISKALDETLKAGTVGADRVPFLPMWNAGQVFHTNVGFYSFKNGQGLRYLSCYAQAIVPLDSVCLFYTYQGKTADGNYYISAIFPVQLAVLDTPAYKSKFETAAADGTKYDAYIKEVIPLIDQAKPGDFSPNLSDLDQVLMSLSVSPTETLKAPQAAALACPGSMASRLRSDMKVRVTFTDGTPLRLRDGAGKDTKTLNTIKEGGTMTIVGGPACVSAGVWWKVKLDGSSQMGWVLEGEKGVYFVEPAP